MSADPVQAPDGAKECHSCDGYGYEGRVERVGDTGSDYVEATCRWCDGRGWATKAETKAYWSAYFRARKAPWRGGRRESHEDADKAGQAAKAAIRREAQEDRARDLAREDRADEARELAEVREECGR